MSGLAPISWIEFEKFLEFIGCNFKREASSHRVWVKAGLARPIIVPKYKSIPIFVIRNNLRTLGISVQEYLDILSQL